MSTWVIRIDGHVDKVSDFWSQLVTCTNWLKEMRTYTAIETRMIYTQAISFFQVDNDKNW